MKIYSLAILASAATALSVATNLSSTTAGNKRCYNKPGSKAEICCKVDEFGDKVCKDKKGNEFNEEKDCYEDADGKFVCMIDFGF